LGTFLPALKEREDLTVGDVPAETPSWDHCEIAVDVEVAKITSENLTTSEGQDAAETAAEETPDDAEQGDSGGVTLVVRVIAQCNILSARIFGYFC
jgi:hypothetical protein